MHRNRARRDGLPPEFAVPALGVKCEIGREYRIGVKARFTDTEGPRVIFGVLQQDVAKTFALAVRPYRNVLDQQVIRLRYHLDQTEELPALFAEIDHMLAD